MSEPPGKPKNTGVGKHIPSPADLPKPGIEPESPALQADSLPAELPGKPKVTLALCIMMPHELLTLFSTSLSLLSPLILGFRMGSG